MVPLLFSTAVHALALSSIVGFVGTRPWTAVSLSNSQSLTAPAEIAASLVASDCVIELPGIASKGECQHLIDSCVASAAAQSSEPRTGLDAVGLVRLPSLAAAARAAKTGTPCASPVSADADALAEELLLRCMSVLEENFPTLRPRLFGDASESLCAMYRAGELEFSSREPGINVYGAGGQFLPHKDHQALTVLLPLSQPCDFEGGGTSFWHQDSRGHRVEAPSVVLRPPAGSALIFSGHVTHAGVPVDAGTRVAYVASFSARGGRRLRQAASTVSFDVYGDVI